MSGALTHEDLRVFGRDIREDMRYMGETLSKQITERADGIDQRLDTLNGKVGRAHDRAAMLEANQRTFETALAALQRGAKRAIGADGFVTKREVILVISAVAITYGVLKVFFPVLP